MNETLFNKIVSSKIIDKDFFKIKLKIKKAVNNVPKKITFELALKQIKEFKG